MSAPPAFLHPFARPAAQEFLSIIRGDGALVWDDAGKEYVDGMAGLWYCNIGYGREEMAQAVAAQLRALGAYHAFERFTVPTADELAERISELAPGARGSF